MSITKRPSNTTPPAAQAVDEFINRAPDASAANQAVTPARKNKVQIALTIHPDLLAAIDALAQKKGLSRAGAISLACAELVEEHSRQ